MFNRVPFGSTGRVVGHGKSQAERIGQLRLEFGFPGAATSAVAAPGVAQNEELPGSRISECPFLAPPICDGVGRKSGCVVRDADRDRPSVGMQIIDAVGDGDTGGIRAEIMVVDQAGDRSQRAPGFLKLPTSSRFFVSTLMMGRPRLEALTKITQIEELIVAVGAKVGGEFLVIDAQGITHLVEEASDGVGAHTDTEVAQRHGNLLRSAPRPLQTGDGIASGIVFQQELDQCDDVGGFFSIGLRPPPERRVRPVDTF